MATKAIKIKETNKIIFIQDDFVSAPKSLLSTSIFNIKGRAKEINIIKNDFMGYDKLSIKGQSLNTGLDFQLFTSILINLHDDKSNNFTISIDDFYKRIDPENKQPQNKNKIFIERIQESAKRLMDLKVEIISKNGKFVFATLFPTIAADADKKEIYISINPDISNIFKIDSNAIYNIDFKIYNLLNSDYSKILYLYYITNNVNIINKFSVEKLKERLMCEDVIDKKFNLNVSNAHKELMDVGFLKYAQKVKKGGCSRVITHYEVSTKTNVKEAKKDNNKNEDNKENNNILPILEVKNVNVEEIISKLRKPTLEEIIEQQNSDKIRLEFELYLNKGEF